MANRKASGQIGHRKTLNGKKKEILYGNGCPKHPESCFTCPLFDCEYPDGRSRK